MALTPALRSSMRSGTRMSMLSRAPLLTRSFRTTSIRRASKETAEGSEARKQEIEREKQQQLQAQKEGKAEWKDALASESESITKADRGEMKADANSIKKLQEESAKAAQQEKK